MRTGMGDGEIFQRRGSRVAGCRGLLQHERSLLSGVTWHQLCRPPGQRQQPVGMSWADGKVNHSAETWAQSHLTLQLLKSVPFQAAGVWLKLSSLHSEMNKAFIQSGGFTGFSVKLKYE